MAPFATGARAAGHRRARPPTNIALPISPVLGADQARRSRGGDRRRRLADRRPRARARLDRPHQLAARARAAAGDRAAAGRGPRGAGDRAGLRPDAGAVPSGSASSTPRSAAIAARDCSTRRGAWPPARPQLTRWARAPALRPRDRPRLQRHHGRRRGAADPVLDDVRLRVGDRPAHRQLPAGPGRRRPRRDPARAPVPLRRPRQAAPLSRAQGGVLPGRLHARPGGARASWRSIRRSRSRSSAPRRRCRSITASRTTSSARCWSGCAAARRWCCRARPSSARELTARGRLHRSPRRAIDAQSLIAFADLVVSAGRHDEPRGGGARNAGVHGVRGPAGRRRRAA